MVDIGQFISLREHSMNAQELKKTLSSGLLSFPVTDFDGEGNFRADSYAQGIPLLPHYLTEAKQEGLVAHVEEICRSVDISEEESAQLNLLIAAMGPQ